MGWGRTPFSEWRERSGERISKMPGNSGAGGRPGDGGTFGDPCLRAQGSRWVRGDGGRERVRWEEGGREAGEKGQGERREGPASGARQEVSAGGQGLP